jgi:low affinity Fe/Cu permease
MSNQHIFAIVAKKTADWTGRPVAFILAFLIVLAWGITGPMFHYSDTWQLVINTGTTIVTFLMVFLIQNAQNRDTKALQIKLDELIRVTEGAHTALLDLEELDDTELKEFSELYCKIAAEARAAMDAGGDDTHVAHIDMPLHKAPAPKKPRRSLHRKKPA